ncbi:hypothetical membrane protein [Syntrophus aciditrophicus SB]|jgi:hypothetical protein|uniref:Hypothetical membrane protein n=1 Tax=Syntrophus aciditrophicus (strain SB) TaxID=56780 RepID=Q2LX44_SYNAS|nr:hypothetical membrane protein [Syntrophus aciditrophicus SB]
MVNGEGPNLDGSGAIWMFCPAVISSVWFMPSGRRSLYISINLNAADLLENQSPAIQFVRDDDFFLDEKIKVQA